MSSLRRLCRLNLRLSTLYYFQRTIGSYPGDFSKERSLYGKLIDKVSNKYSISNDNIFRNVISSESIDEAKIEIVGTDNMGLGARALHFLRKGEVLIVETPLVTFPRVKGKNGSILSHFGLLSESDKVSYIGLSDSGHYSSVPLNGDVLANMVWSKTLEGIKINNAVTLSSTSFDTTLSGIFLVIHRMNHSCLPNAIFSFNSDTNKGSVFALEDIPQGEEITLCYFKGNILNSQERSDYLLSYNISPCRCAKCTAEQQSALNHRATAGEAVDGNHVDHVSESDIRVERIKLLQSDAMHHAQQLRAMRDELAYHDSGKQINAVHDSDDDNVLDLESHVRQALTIVTELTNLLQKEGLDRSDDKNWLNIIAYWITDDPAYACLAYLHTVRYRGRENSTASFHMIPAPIRTGRVLPNTYLDGRQCCYDEFKGMDSEFEAI
jgi:hypothetical protein